MRQKGWIEEIDYLRAFAILAVVMLHVMEWKQSYNINTSRSLDPIVLMIHVFAGYGVPLFIFISGFTLSSHYNKNFSTTNFYRKRFNFILPPYLLFSIIYILFDYIQKDSFTISKTIFKILSGTAYGHLWFFPLIVQFYILYPYIIKYFNNSNNKFKILFLSLLLQVLFFIVMPLLYGYFLYYSDPMNKIIGIIIQTLFLNDLFYFVLGLYLQNNYAILKNKINNLNLEYILFIIIFMVLLVVFVSFLFYTAYTNNKYNFYQYKSSYYYPLIRSLSSIIYILIFTILFKLVNISMTRKNTSSFNEMMIEANDKETKPEIKVESRLFILLKNIGFYSFGIYLIHYLLLGILRILLENSNFISLNMFAFFIYYFIILLLSYVTLYIINFIPGSGLFTGLKNKPFLSYQ